MNKPLFKLALPLCLIFLQGCIEKLDTNPKPWVGFATHTETGRVEWWLNTHSTYSRCKEQMVWDVNNTIQGNWYREPVGCGYSGNSILAIQVFYSIYGDKEFFSCILKNKDPASEDFNVRYYLMLRDYADQCVTNTERELIRKN